MAFDLNTYLDALRATFGTTLVDGLTAKQLDALICDLYSIDVEDFGGGQPQAAAREMRCRIGGEYNLFSFADTLLVRPTYPILHTRAEAERLLTESREDDKQGWTYTLVDVGPWVTVEARREAGTVVGYL